MSSTYDWSEKCHLGRSINHAPVTARESDNSLCTIREASQHGCPLCTLLISAAEEVVPGWTTTDEKSKSIQFGTDWERFGHSWNGTLALNKSGNEETKFQLVRRFTGHLYDIATVKNSPYSRAPILATSLDVIENSSSPLAFDRARAWLEYCEQHDVSCRAPVTLSAFQPTRLLDVRSLAASDEVKLVCPTQPVKYACLSYCWGADLVDVLTTSMANLEDHHQGISRCNLPKALQDAVMVCRGIGIDYLWVDSVCIVQDDPQDWQHESHRMIDVYGRSHLAIYSNKAVSCKMSFLGPQKYSESQWQRLMQTPIPYELDAKDTELFARFEQPDRSRITSGTPLGQGGIPRERQAIAKSSLDDRAWCLQEDILPSRRLYYDGNEMSWECSHRRLCECGHLTDDLGREDYSVIHELPYSRVKESAKSEKKEELFYYKHWLDSDWIRLVEDYTSRTLSKPEDKLVALSGVATMMQTAYGLHFKGHVAYYAGLWERNFVQWLAWVRMQDPTPIDEELRVSGADDIRYRAPTWSWALLDGPVAYDSYRAKHTWKYTPHQITRVVVNEISCIPKEEESPTGKIKSGHVHLTGPLVAVDLVRIHYTDGPNPDFKRSAIYRLNKPVAWVRGKNLESTPVFLDVPIGRTLSSDDEQAECWLKRKCKCGSCVWPKETEAAEEGTSAAEKTLFAFELFTWQTSTSRSKHERLYYKGMSPETWFLLLRRTAAGVFERVGVGKCEGGGKEWPRIDPPDDSGLRWEPHIFHGSRIESVKIV